MQMYIIVSCLCITVYREPHSASPRRQGCQAKSLSITPVKFVYVVPRMH